MEIFGIVTTPGHFIVAAILMVIYDAIWTFAFSNKLSAWWFERLQGLLKGGIYFGFIALVVLLVCTPWPFNLILIISTGLAILLTVLWVRRKNQKETEEEKEEEEEKPILTKKEVKK